MAALDYLVALGTHTPMTDEQLGRHIGQTVVDGLAGQRRIFNHRWDDPKTFVKLGEIPAHEIAELTGGRLKQNVPVALNRLLVDYDHVLICGPVFPHEVVGFSGGTKYLFPGVAAADIIHFTHWLGALITSYDVIGTADTPVRAVINRAASLLWTPLSLLAVVVTHDGIAGMYCGEPQAAWRQAAALSARRHIVWIDKPYQRALAVMPRMYDDLWTAAKGMYKIEPAIADGGEVVIFAPHVTEVSYVHGKLLDEVGYHCRDYFLVAVGQVQALSRRHPRPLDARQGPRRLRCVVCAGNAPDSGHAGHRHSAGAVRADQSRLPRSGYREPGGLGRKAGLAGGAARG